MSESVNEAQNALLKMEELNDAREVSIAKMELLNDQLLMKLESRDKELEESKQLLQDQAMQHKIILEEVSSNMMLN